MKSPKEDYMNCIISLFHKIVPEKHRPLTRLLATLTFAVLSVYLVSRENPLTSALLGLALFIGFIPVLDNFKEDCTILIFHNITSALLVAGHLTFGPVSFTINVFAVCLIIVLIMMCIDHLETKGILKDCI